jgi:hypothetical protein
MFLTRRIGMKQRIARGGIALTIALFISVFAVSAAFAHEVRPVGPYTFVVGFINEPAYAGQQNSVDLTICKGEKCNYEVKDGLRVLSNPVTDADKTLKAEVNQGSAAPLALPLKPRFNNPGKYASYFVPSKAGTYAFHFFGTLEGNQINEKFTSGPNTFGDADQIHVYPSVASSPSQADIQATQDNANRATTLGIIGIVVGVLGLAVGGFALVRRPRGGVAAQKEVSQSTVESLGG